jgi:hypothetical protein
MPRSQSSFRAVATGVLLGLLLLLPGCGGGDGGGGPTQPPPPPPPAPVASVQFGGGAPAPLVVGSTVQLQAITLDASGGVLNGRAVTWASSALGVATVSGTGLVTAVTPGEALITATSEGRSAQLTITVIPPPVASVEVAPTVLELDAGETAPLTAILRDASGNELTGREVVWEASDTGVATVDDDGVVTAAAPGNAVLTATSEGRTGGANLTVFSATAPRISSIEPAVLVEGETATVAGVRFAPDPGDNQVLVGGVAAQVLSASATGLSFRVPEGACLPEGTQSVQVTVAAEAAQRSHPFRPASFLDVPVGQLRIIRAPAELCLQLPATGGTGNWLVGVQSVSQTPDLRTPVLVTGLTGSAGTQAASGTPSFPRPPAFATQRPSAGALQPDFHIQMAAHDALHLRHMEETEALVSRILARGGPAAMAPPSAVSVPPTVQVGDTVNIQVVFGGCAAPQPPARMEVRVVGTRSIVVTDNANPQGGYTQEELQGIADFIDTQIFARHEEHFGSFTDVDNNGRLVVVISRRVNDIGGLLGFVSGVDLLSPQSCPASNFGEYLYVITPDPDAAETSFLNKANALADLPRLAAHEITHVVQLARRRVAAQPSLPIWVLEGQAVMGEEITARGVLGLQGRENFGRQRVINPDEGAGTFWFRQRFFDLFRYFGFRTNTERNEGAPDGCGWLGREGSPDGISGPCNYNRLPYGPAWSFLRWTADHFGDRVGGDAGFNRAIVSLPQGSLDALGGLVGEDYRDLLAYWAATLYTDDRAAGFEPLLTFPSWNLRDIENAYVSTVRLVPYEQGFAPFERPLTLAAGSSAYLRVSGTNQPGTAIRVQSGGGTAPPGTVQMWVVRLP